MKESIKKFNSEDEYYFEEGCYIMELYNSPDDPELSIARARVSPGVTTRWHRLHGITERYYIIEGKAIAEIGDLPPQKVSNGDIIFIPRLCRQRIKNTGKKDLIFLAVCTPRFYKEAYEDIDIRAITISPDV